MGSYEEVKFCFNLIFIGSYLLSFLMEEEDGTIGEIKIKELLVLGLLLINLFLVLFCD
jgi:hypothetical protein